MATQFDELEGGDQLLGYTVEIVTAHVSHNSVAMADVPSFIQNVHAALAGLTAPAEPEETAAVPIIDPRKSVKPDHLICLECGKKCQTLKTHLRSVHGLEFDEYREKYGLPDNYPSSSAKYLAGASERAIRLGLGGKMLEARNAHRKKVGKPPIRHKPPPKVVAVKS